MGHLHRLIVFDLDGTLIDSRQDLTDSANALVTERGGRALAPGDVAGMVGDGAAMLVRRALAAAGLEMDEASVPRFLEIYGERLLLTTRPYPGILAALGALAPRATLAVLTNKPQKPARLLLEALALDRFFSTLIGGDGPFPRKPDPASLVHLMRLHGAGRQQTVLVGDSRIDLDTARAAGVGVCLVRYGFGYQTVPGGSLHTGETVADDPRDIPGLIESLLAGHPPEVHEG